MRVLLALVGVTFLLASMFVVMSVAIAQPASSARGPVLLTVFIITLVGALLCITLLLRWLLRPYRKLVGEAERAPVALRSANATNEAEFVLETFQSVIARLQAQQRELETLSAKASARAASAEKFSERIVASVPSSLVAFDAQGNATVVNAPARALIETNGNHLGQPVRSLLKAAPDLAEMVETCLRTGELYRREEVALVGASGRTKKLGVTVAPIELEREQGPRGALCLITDLTEVMQLREQVALKRSLESLGEMSAGLSHEFKNSLATLHGYAQLLQNLNLDERGQAAASALLQEVRGLSTMVTAFLNFARPQPLQREDVSLGELLQECRAELQPLFDERGVTLAIEGEFFEMHADERMLRQALLNLIRNAAEAIDTEVAQRRVVVRGTKQRDDAGEEWAAIEITDTGEGIPEKDLQRIFIPFFTTKSKGHGVGLALAHRVIAEHGGTLTATNARDGHSGAVFTVRLRL
jgi:nitrogen fixation/metabolism regulation signal transduction histidine kinase